MISKPETFVFYGRSGCGKGTQAKLINAFLEKDSQRKILYVETGALLRAFAAKEGYGSVLVKEVLEAGGLLPAFVPVYLWGGFLLTNVVGTEHLVFDGVCRRPSEALVFDSALHFFKRGKPNIVVINVSNEWAVERLKARGRNDDTHIDKIKNRQSWYEKDVLPTIEFFRQNSYYNVVDINGEQTIEEVHKEILQKTGLSV